MNKFYNFRLFMEEIVTYIESAQKKKKFSLWKHNDIQKYDVMIID